MLFRSLDQIGKKSEPHYHEAMDMAAISFLCCLDAEERERDQLQTTIFLMTKAWVSYNLVLFWNGLSFVVGNGFCLCFLALAADTLLVIFFYTIGISCSNKIEHATHLFAARAVSYCSFITSILSHGGSINLFLRVLCLRGDVSWTALVASLIHHQTMELAASLITIKYLVLAIWCLR